MDSNENRYNHYKLIVTELNGSTITTKTVWNLGSCLDAAADPVSWMWSTDNP